MTTETSAIHQAKPCARPLLQRSRAPSADGKTAVRSGYGIYYDAPRLWPLNNANNVSPFSYSVLFFEGQLENPYLGREKSNKVRIGISAPPGDAGTASRGDLAEIGVGDAAAGIVELRMV